MTTNFVVTTDRLIYRVGVIAKNGIEIPLERINTVFFNQRSSSGCSAPATSRIESGGETGKQTFSDIRQPSLVQNEIYRQMEANNARMYGGSPGRRRRPDDDPRAPRPPVGAEQIEKLDELRQRGVLTEAEFAEKKAELLKRM